uniref:N-acetylmuramoyl-L-alanine amidase family protein n=1 Tax=Castellaniella defragrans TaxID=75697 RepID=UPI0033427357
MPCALLALCCVLPAQAAHILVDTGHTPGQPGATGASGRVEYSYNRDLTGALARALAALGDRVTRLIPGDDGIALAARPAVAPDADLFVSIHHDSIQPQYIDAGRRGEFAGYSIFASKRNPHYAQSLRCAQAIGGALRDAGEKPSAYHAEPIPGENRPFLDRARGVHRYDDLVVLRTANMPAVLIEAGVIANPAEEARLAQAGTIGRLAQAIAQGVQACLD